MSVEHKFGGIQRKEISEGVVQWRWTCTCGSAGDWKDDREEAWESTGLADHLLDGVIDLLRSTMPREKYGCPGCGRELTLPVGWQQNVQRGVEVPMDWDGKLRCRPCGGLEMEVKP